MRSIWKGSITFGLVNVPVSLYPATQREEIKFHLLRTTDLSPIQYKRVAEVDGKEVPWDQIVKGYEYEKGRFVVLKDEDFKRVDVEATQTIEITDFVELKEIDPVLFNKPYYLEPQKGAARVYHLLREALLHTGKIGIAKVVIKTRQYLAAVKATDERLVLEVMHFADELIDPRELKIPAEPKLPARELQMAETLVSQMTAKWDPSRYVDEYKAALLELIEQKVKAGGRAVPTAARGARHAEVIDLMTALRKSLDQTSARHAKPETAHKRRSRKKAA